MPCESRSGGCLTGKAAPATSEPTLAPADCGQDKGSAESVTPSATRAQLCPVDLANAKNNLQAALDQAAKGIPVFPCRRRAEYITVKGERVLRGEKSPYTKNGFKDATTDPRQIRKWWRAYPDAYIGYPTGRITDTFIVDVDPKGRAWFEAHKHEFPATHIRYTKRGMHLVYRMSEQAVSISESAAAEGIDTRGDGGYAIYWPAEGCETSGEFDDRGLPPQWFIDLLLAGGKKRDKSAEGGDSWDPLAVDNHAGVDLTETFSTICSGAEGLHGAIRNTAARFAAMGLRPEDSRAILRGAAQVADDGSDRMHQRIADIDRAVKSAHEKFATGRGITGPDEARFQLDELTGTPYAPPVIVDGYMLQDAGGFVGPGGFGKTTLAISEAIHIILDRSLYGREIIRPGACVFVTAEDTKLIIGGRLNQILRAMGLTPAEVEKVRQNFYVEDLSCTMARLVTEHGGRLMQTLLISDLIERYKGTGVSYLHLDPTSLLGPGEIHGNDGMAELMRASRRLSIELQTAVRLVHHVSQNVARSGITDQYAGRGGTAFADNSRFQHQLIQLTERKIAYEGGLYEAPPEISEKQILDGNALAIFVHKLSYQARGRAPIFITRDGFRFTHHESLLAASGRTTSKPSEHVDKVVSFLMHEMDEGRRLARINLERRRDELKLSRDKLREAIDEAIRIGRILEKPLPEAEQQGARKTYLHPVEDPL